MRKPKGVNKALEALTLHESITRPYVMYFEGRITCPFCDTPYRSISDHDDSIPCVLCLGSAAKAKELDDILTVLLVYAAESKDIDTLKRMEKSLRGYWHFEVARRIRHFEKQAQENSESGA